MALECIVFSLTNLYNENRISFVLCELKKIDWRLLPMKKLFSKACALLLAGSMCLSLAACGPAPAATPSAGPTASQTAGLYIPGTYTATAPGLKGDVTVEVVFTADKIENVKVTAHQETEGIGTTPVEQLPDAIVESQSLAVDVIAGATYTSDAILAAVEDCVKQAGGDPEALKQTAGNENTAKEQKTLSADLVIVGGGAAGMSACIRAAELGLDVILLEKMSFMGGAVSISGGNQVVMGSQLQKDAGVTDDTVDSMVEDFMKNGANLNVPELIGLYATHVGETSDWLQNVGVTFSTEGGLHKLAEYSHDRELAYTGGGAGAATAMKDAIAKTDTRVLLDTRATELLTDASGNVVGVLAGDKKTEYTIDAKAVLLATGGYGNNKDLLTGDMSTALYYGPASSTGDGITMATAAHVGAATRLMEFGKRYPNGIEVSAGIAKSTIGGNIAAWGMGAILVNPEGERVVNEKASNRTILETELEQTNQMLYLLMDEATFSVWKTKIGGAGISEEDVNTYLAQNGASAPVFAHADTLEELAGIVGMESAALKATVETYNGYVKAGEDKAFGRPADFMKAEIGAGPYYLVEQKPRFATTMGGLVVNEDLAVENAQGAVIGNLYAAGEVVGGVMGDDSPSGANNGWAVTSGKLAAEAIAEALGLGKSQNAA